jgi:hypothetical protein
VFSWIYKNLILKIIGWLTGKDIDFDQIVEWVRVAEGTGRPGKEKSIMVQDQISELFKILVPWILNLLVELAVAYCKKMGWIK